MNDDAEIRITLGEREYVWDGDVWYDAHTFTAPATSVITELNALSGDQIAALDDHVRNPIELVQKATKAKNEGQLDRAVRLVRRALQIESQSQPAATVLSSALRSLGRANDALAVKKCSRIPRPARS